MSKTHVIDGVTYVEVERKAKVGDTVIIVDAYDVNGDGYINGNVFTIGNIPLGFTDVVDTVGNISLFDKEYHVLEPLESTDVIDIIANLARRVSSLEQQLRDTQGNVEKLAEEIVENKHHTYEIERDVIELEKQIDRPKEGEKKSSTPAVFDIAKIKSFKLSDLSGKKLRIHSATDTSDGVSVTTTVAIDEDSGKMFVLESEVIAQ
jgi:hypothetical protein